MRSLWTMMLALSMTATFGVAVAMADSAPEKPKEEPKKEEPKKEEPKDEAMGLPWTVDEIKKTVKKGTTFTIKTEQTMGEKSTSGWSKMEIVDATDETYKMKETKLDAEKKEVGKPKESEKKWADYMNMKMKKANVTVTEESIEVTAGKFDCIVHKNVETKGGAEFTQTVWFAKDKPGTLVKMTVVSATFSATYTLEEYKMGE